MARVNRDLTNVKLIGNDQEGWQILRICQNYHDRKQLGSRSNFALLEDAELFCQQAKYVIVMVFDTSRVGVCYGEEG
jgi:hypothetical protein